MYCIILTLFGGLTEAETDSLIGSVNSGYGLIRRELWLH